jgi:signal transduction histidine kinase/FixJ family two-component response regulator
MQAAEIYLQITLAALIVGVIVGACARTAIQWLAARFCCEHSEQPLAKRLAAAIEPVASPPQPEECDLPPQQLALGARDEFLANMSHEIRTPMTAILGYVEVLMDDLDTTQEPIAERWRGPLTTIRSNGQHLLQLINDILDIAKVEAGRLSVERIPCSIGQIVQDVVNLLRHRAEEKGLALSVRYRSEIPQVIYSDPTRIRQILLNLVGNAIKFTAQGKVLVDLSFQSSGAPPALLIEVVDTGIGISEEQRARLFEPFIQADASTTRKFGGTGLGLTITRRLCELLGGSIAATSKLGRGSTFLVTLPCGSVGNLPMIDQPLLNVVTASRRPVDIRLNCRVLLAEDGPDNQRLIRALLEKAGADVTVVDNGQAALELALQAAAGELPTKSGLSKPFDVLLLDIQMPVLDGWQAARKLRASGYAQPIVALTANALPEDRRKCLAAGCDDFLSKPIERAILLTTVAHWAESGAARRLGREDWQLAAVCD